MASKKALNQFMVLLILLINCFALLSQCAKLHNTEVEDLVTATCKHTLYFKVCISSLKSVPSSHKASDPKMLAKIALNLSTKYAAKTLSYVSELKSSYAVNETTTSKSYKSPCLSDCKEEYSEAIQNLKDSAEALNNGEYDRVDVLVSAAMSDAETCEDGFKDIMHDDDYGGGSTIYSDLSDRNRYFSELCSNTCSSIYVGGTQMCCYG